MLTIRVFLVILSILLSIYCYMYWKYLKDVEAKNDFKNKHPIIYFFAEYLVFFLAVSLIIFVYDFFEKI